MKIRDLLKPESIVINAPAKTKDEAISMLIDKHDEAGNLSDKQVYTDGILKRESESTTAIGEGIAIPHCKSDSVINPGLAAMTVPEGIDYGAPDGQPSNLVFMIAAPMDGDLHLDVLAKLMTLLMDLDLRKRLLAAESGEAFLDELNKAEAAKFPEEAEESADEASAAAVSEDAAASEETKEGAYRVLAVTACPTGIAHTYMAAEALNQKAEEMGISIKVETNGSGGAKNELTADDIAAAEAIIVAADKQVAMARFAGKKVLKTKVADGINKPEELINKALSDSCPVFEGEALTESAEADTLNESMGRKIYKALMNGVSYMLPFVIGGGIMIALAFLIDTQAGAPRDGNFGTYTAAAAFFKGAGGVAFGFMLPVLAGFIAHGIADRPAIAVGFTGGALAAAGSTFAEPAGDAAAVSGFLGALLAGFAGGLIVLMLNKLFGKMPEFVQRMMPVLIIPLLGITLMSLLMFAINPFIGMINSGLTNALSSMGDSSAILLGCIVAAVMIGGMIPPIAIALSTTFFKNRWTDNERKSGPVNYIMGLCFITEGAIPYAAADPLRVIPSCIVGSALGGALSMAFGCTLMAPHGGIFVFPVVGHVLGYIIALVAGAAAGMVMLALLKKKQPVSQ